MTSSVYSVPAMSCQHCSEAITTEVEQVAGVTHVNVDLEAKTVSVKGGDAEAIIAAIGAAGYDTV